MHDAAVKIARGELFEAVGFLAFLREQVLGPLGVLRAGGRPAGVRRIETVAPDLAEELLGTLAGHDPDDCLRALRRCVELYRNLRPRSAHDRTERGAEIAVMELLERLEEGPP